MKTAGSLGSGCCPTTKFHEIREPVTSAAIMLARITLPRPLSLRSPRLESSRVPFSATQFRHALVGRWCGYPHGAGTIGAQGHRYDDDLYPRDESAVARGQKSGRFTVEQPSTAHPQAVGCCWMIGQRGQRRFQWGRSPAAAAARPTPKTLAAYCPATRRPSRRITSRRQ